MRSDWAADAPMEHVLAAMMPANRLVFEVCRETGLRVSDALNLRTEKLRQRMTVRELKTGKTRRIYLPTRLYDRLLGHAGKIWVFESRTDYRKHRTRQAVYNDVKRCTAVFERSGALPRGANITPHTARKMRAVEEYKATGGSLDACARLLNHDSGHELSTTALYALADCITTERLAGGVGHRRRAKRSQK